jgi:hypothetical protein
MDKEWWIVVRVPSAGRTRLCWISPKVVDAREGRQSLEEQVHHLGYSMSLLVRPGEKIKLSHPKIQHVQLKRVQSISERCAHQGMTDHRNMVGLILVQSYLNGGENRRRGSSNATRISLTASEKQQITHLACSSAKPKWTRMSEPVPGNRAELSVVCNMDASVSMDTL